MIVQAHHFDTKRTNERFTLFLLANNYKPGDALKLYEFQIWISKQLREFELTERVSMHKTFPENEQMRFTEFLKSKVQPEQMKLFY